MRSILEKPLVLICLNIFVIFASSSAIGALLKSISQLHDPRYRVDYGYALSLPIPVLQDLPNGWKVLVVLWLMVGLFAYLTIRISLSLARRQNFGLLTIVFAMLVLGLAYSAFVGLMAGDLYAYVIYGRLFGVYHINPYFLPHTFRTNDPILLTCFRFYGNPPPIDNYGPAWTLIAGSVSRAISSLGLAQQVWTFRLLGLFAGLFAAGGLWRALSVIPIEERRRRISRFCFHPLVLFESVAGGHNDMLMLAPAIWSFALADAYPIAAGVLIGLSISVKYVSLLLLPFILVRVWRTKGAPMLIGSLFATALVVVVAYALVGGAQGALLSLLTASRELRTSPAWLITLPLYYTGAGTVHIGGVTLTDLTQIIVLAAGAGVIAFAVYKYFRREDKSYMWLAITALIFSLPSIYPWYALWLSPALASTGKWARFSWAFCALIFVEYVQTVVRQPENTASYNLMVFIIALATLGFLFVPFVMASERAVPQTHALS